MFAFKTLNTFTVYGGEMILYTEKPSFEKGLILSVR